MSYYKTIDGKKMDGTIIDSAAEASKGAGDGRISKDDAMKIFNATKDAGKITKTEIVTLAYVYHNYNWTEAAASWFADQLSKHEGLAK